MRFDAFVLGAGRILSPRTFELIVAPALADSQFDRERGRCSFWRAYLPVLIALAAGVRIDVARQSGMFLFLTLVPACYNAALLTICGDFFKQTQGLLVVGLFISIFSFTPALMCFWPERGSSRAR